MSDDNIIKDKEIIEELNEIYNGDIKKLMNKDKTVKFDLRQSIINDVKKSKSNNKKDADRIAIELYL